MNKNCLLPEIRKRVIISNILFCFFILFSVIALINPKWGTTNSIKEYRRGVDIVFAIDVSRSMDIRDIAGIRNESRLERSINIARNSALSMPGARYACAIGRGAGYLSVPLTYDTESVFNFLSSLDFHSMTGRSTNLQALTEAAAGAFLSTSLAKKAIVLFSDGETHMGVMQNAVNRCIRDGIIIIAVAVGSDEGAFVPGFTDNETVPVSRRDTVIMKMAAERTGGIYIDGNRDDSSSVLSAHLLNIANTGNSASLFAGLGGEQETEPKQRRELFIIFALITYAAYKFVPRLGGKK